MPTAKTRKRTIKARARRARPKPQATTVGRRRVHSTARTGERRAARLHETLSQRPRSMSVEFEDLGPEQAPDMEEDEPSPSPGLR